MGNTLAGRCCAQSVPTADTWKRDKRRDETRDPAIVASAAAAGIDLTPYAYEPSLSMDTDECVLQIHDGLGVLAEADAPSAVTPLPTGQVASPSLSGGNSVVEEAVMPGQHSPHHHPLIVRRGHSLGSFGDLELDDYLCSCLYCPRAVAIQRAYQLYGFALDHPQSEALMRVLRACANYDETVVEIDPLLVLHAEKLLEELQLEENDAFRLLVASHFRAE